ncbi:MAG: mannose-6P isomerase [Satyrvirus sp.]|uniref:Mannose-6P isomerase n=1 Tax=Satyrvirus sp. TaxID=2487771 RepID=A0A3G5ADD7_9VIRU|nr:MAG: mannose-6P isomerase [Satyrvirus sp.]
MSNQKVFVINIEEETIKNTFFRRVLFTSNNQQLVVMSLKPKEDIPLEIHPKHDQFIRVEQGNGIAIIGKDQNIEHKLSDGFSITIPANTWHRIVNTSSKKDLKLYTIYSPPEHQPCKVDIDNYKQKYLKYKSKYLESKK